MPNPKTNKRSKKPTPEELKKWKKQTGACDHNKIGYPALSKLPMVCLKEVSKTQKILKTLFLAFTDYPDL